MGRHLIRIHEYKNAIDADGNHQSSGVERDVPWVAITPVVNAIRVLERMVPDGSLLFDGRAHDLRYHRPGTGSLKPAAIRHRIEDFVAWPNTDALTHHLPGEVIPADPHSKIGTARFRRSLAWHIARRPMAWSPWPSSTATCAPPSPALTPFGSYDSGFPDDHAYEDPAVPARTPRRRTTHRWRAGQRPGRRHLPPPTPTATSPPCASKQPSWRTPRRLLAPSPRHQRIRAELDRVLALIRNHTRKP